MRRSKSSILNVLKLFYFNCLSLFRINDQTLCFLFLVMDYQEQKQWPSKHWLLCSLKWLIFIQLVFAQNFSYLLTISSSKALTISRFWMNLARVNIFPNSTKSRQFSLQSNPSEKWYRSLPYIFAQEWGMESMTSSLDSFLVMMSWMADSLMKLYLREESLLMAKLCPLAFFFRFRSILEMSFSLDLFSQSLAYGCSFGSSWMGDGTFLGELAQLLRNYLNWLVKKMASELLLESVWLLLMYLGNLIYSSQIWGQLSLREDCSSMLLILTSGFSSTTAGSCFSASLGASPNFKERLLVGMAYTCSCYFLQKSTRLLFFYGEMETESFLGSADSQQNQLASDDSSSDGFMSFTVGVHMGGLLRSDWVSLNGRSLSVRLGDSASLSLYWLFLKCCMVLSI